MYHDRIWIQTIVLFCWVRNNRCSAELEASDSGERYRMRLLGPIYDDTPRVLLWGYAGLEVMHCCLQAVFSECRPYGNWCMLRSFVISAKYCWSLPIKKALSWRQGSHT